MRCRPTLRPIRRQLRERSRQLDTQLVPKSPPRQGATEALGKSRLPRLVDVNRQGRYPTTAPRQDFGEGDHSHDGRGIPDVRPDRGEHSQQPPGALLRQTPGTTEIRPHVSGGEGLGKSRRLQRRDHRRGRRTRRAPVDNLGRRQSSRRRRVKVDVGRRPYLRWPGSGRARFAAWPMATEAPIGRRWVRHPSLCVLGGRMALPRHHPATCRRRRLCADAGAVGVRV